MSERRNKAMDSELSPSAMLDAEVAPQVNAPPGTELLLEIDGVYGHLKSELVGYRAAHYIMLRTPVGPSGFAARLTHGNGVVVHYVHGGSVYGFQTTILNTIAEPEPLIFIACPRLMQQRSLRHAQRVDTYIVCNATVQQHVAVGTLIDISRRGYACVLPTHLPEGTLQAAVGQPITVNLELGDTPLSILGVVRNVTEFPASVRLGVRFEGNDRATEERIIGFLIKEGAQA